MNDTEQETTEEQTGGRSKNSESQPERPELFERTARQRHRHEQLLGFRGYLKPLKNGRLLTFPT